MLQNFPPQLITLSPRVTRTGDPSASIEGINTTTIADGAFCYCAENKGEYQLDRTDDSTPPDGDLVIAPTAGPGRWKLFPPPPASSGFTGWQTYTPIFNTNNGDGNLGSGGLVARWRQCGVDPNDDTRITVQIALSFNFGNTTSGTGDFSFSVPAIGTIDASALPAGQTIITSTMWLIDDSTPVNWTLGMAQVNSPTDFIIQCMLGASASSGVGFGGVPFTWALQDTIRGHLWVPMVRTP